MTRSEPDHRWKAISESPVCPHDPVEASLWLCVYGAGPECPASQALELYSSKSREGVQGWLLTKATDEEISARTGVPADVLSAYRKIFFDTTVFRHHFDLVNWIQAYNDSEEGSPTGARFMYWAIMYGPEAVAYLSGLPATVDAVEVQRVAMFDCHFRSLMSRDVSIDSKMAKEAMKHRAVALSVADKLAKAAPPSARDFAVKLKHRELTTKIEVVDESDGEILH